MCGLSSHGGNFSCLWCEGEKARDDGQLRTFGSLGISETLFKVRKVDVLRETIIFLDMHFENYREAGYPKKRYAIVQKCYQQKVRKVV